MNRQRNEAARLTRRQALTAGATLVAGVSAVACDGLSTDPATDEGAEGAREAKGREAPALADRVASGDLPPVEERLPASPLVVEPNDRLGVYGGRWRAAMLGPTDTSWLDRSVGYEMLLRWKPDTVAHARDDVVPNVAESVDVNDDGREYVFHLREGMRWSDGEPFTASDVVFAANDVLLNEELYPIPPLALRGAEGASTVEELDSTTVVFRFAEPSGLFLEMMASKNSGVVPLTALPRHYMERFHADHNSDIDALVEEEDAPDWMELFFRKSDKWDNPELPRLHAWVPTNPISDGDRISFERNPFYWKVDPDGSQLPYLDEVRYEFQNEEVMLLQATNGEIDMYDRLINTMQNKPVFAASREQGNYHFVDLDTGNMNVAIISLNLAHEDPVKQEIFQNLEFRAGLSHAINREEIIEAVYQSQGVPWQVAPLPGFEQHDEQLATQYLEYDPDQANSMLDAAGYGERNGDGVRLGPDGEPISFTVEISTRNYGFEWPSVLEMVSEYWREVGVNISIQPEENSLLYERKSANQHDAVVWQGDVGALDPHLDARYLFPYSHESNFATPWATWYQSGGAEGAEPPEPARRQMELFDQFTTTIDQDEQAAAMTQIMRIAAEQFYAIGICYPDSRYGIVKNDFHNVPESFLEASNYPNPGPTNPEQYFMA